METETTSSAVPSGPVRWGIIGCGAIATDAIVPALRWSKVCEFAALASRDIDRARVKGRELAADRVYGSYQELVEDPDIDAVYIGLPNALHEEWVVRAAEAGKHVLCEKSLALTGSAAARAAAACGKAGVLLMEGYMYRHHPQWDVVRSIIRDGRLGEVLTVRSGLAGPVLDTANHRWSAKLGGGALFDVTCYGVNVARMLYRAEPLRVTAMADCQTSQRVDRTSCALLDFGYGRLAAVGGSLATASHQYCLIEGTRGRITVEQPFIPGWDRTGIVVHHGMEKECIEVNGANHFLHQVEHFALCALDRSRPLDPGENGVMQALANEAVVRAWEEDRTVDVPKI